MSCDLWRRHICSLGLGALVSRGGLVVGRGGSLVAVSVVVVVVVLAVAVVAVVPLQLDKERVRIRIQNIMI